MSSCPLVLANAHCNVRARHESQIKSHRYEKEFIFRTNCKLNIRVHGSIFLRTNVDALPICSAISAAPQIRSHCGIVIAGNEKRSVS